MRKRRIPQVAPVTAGGIRYEVVRGARSRGFSQNGSFIPAVGIAPGNGLYTLVLCRTQYDTQEEKNVQDVYVTSLVMSKDGKQLVANSEDKESYAVNLSDRVVTALR